MLTMVLHLRWMISEREPHLQLKPCTAPSKAVSVFLATVQYCQVPRLRILPTEAAVAQSSSGCGFLQHVLVGLGPQFLFVCVSVCSHTAACLVFIWFPAPAPDLLNSSICLTRTLTIKTPFASPSCLQNFCSYHSYTFFKPMQFFQVS